MQCIYKAATLVIILTLINGCAINSSPTGKKSALPKISARQIPGGTTDNWRYLGTTGDGQVAVEINESSIMQAKGHIRYQDRKTIVNNNAVAPNASNKYKYSLSWWDMDCQLKQYIINSTAIYDDYGKLITTYNFNNSAPITIEDKSIAQLQYDYVCRNVNRQLGY